VSLPFVVSLFYNAVINWKKHPLLSFYVLYLLRIMTAIGAFTSHKTKKQVSCKKANNLGNNLGIVNKTSSKALWSFFVLLLMGPTIIQTAYPSLGCGALEPIPADIGRRQGSPWTGQQPISRHT